MPRLFSLLILAPGKGGTIDVRESDAITKEQADEIAAATAEEIPSLTADQVYLYPGPRIRGAVVRKPRVVFGEAAKSKAEPKPRGSRPACATGGCPRKGTKIYGGHCKEHAPKASA